MKTLQNFFKTTVATDWAVGTGNRYITTLPTPTSGWLVVSPNNTSLREIVAYTATGTDDGGNYITISARGVGGTTDQTHSSGEAVRMNITAEHWADIYNNPVFTGNVTVPETPTADTDAASKAWVEDQFLQGAADASTGTKGIGTVSVAPASPTAPIFVGDNDPRVPTQDENNALVGTSGTPSTSNKFVTADDVSSAGASSKIVRLNSSAYPAADGTAITGIALKKEAYTADGDIVQNDGVYVSATNTVKKIYPSGVGTPATVATGFTRASAAKLLPLSTNGMYIHITGGDEQTAALIYAEVRTMNAGETDFSNGSELTVYGTGNGSRVYDVCPLGSDKFLVVFQSSTGGVAAGIKAVVISVSGTTVTAGSVVTIETTGNLSAYVNCAQLDTDKAIIFYQDDAGSDIYSKVLTVSSTTITQNTAVLVKTISSTFGYGSAVQIATNSVVFTYSINAVILYGVVCSVSGTTPSYGSEQTILSAASGSYRHTLAFVSSQKLIMGYEDDSANNTHVINIAISGNTLTPSSVLNLATSTEQRRFGIKAIGEKYALLMNRTSATNYKLHLLDISGSAPTSVSNQDISQSTDSGNVIVSNIVKVKPWTYYVASNISDGDRIVKLTVPSTLMLGLAESAIAGSASGNILNRYTSHTLSGITLAPASAYYIDDTGQPTPNQSLTAPVLGFAINTTKIQLQ